jgi:hypothetical protein
VQNKDVVSKPHVGELDGMLLEEKTMSKDMIGSVVRAAVAVPQYRLDLAAKLCSRLAKDGDEGYDWEWFLTKILKEGFPPIDTTVRVDRAAAVDYLELKGCEFTFLHPELQSTGPAEYDFVQIVRWEHPDQRDCHPSVTGGEICEYLEANNIFESCLGLADGFAIKSAFEKQGLRLRRASGDLLWSGYLWRSAIRTPGGSLKVPYICESGKIVWSSLERWEFYAGTKTLRFPGSC